MSAAEKLRDVIVTSVSHQLGVPPSEILRSSARARRTVDARQVAMWMVREALEQSDLAGVEVHDLFGTRPETVDRACRHVYDTLKLREVAQELLYAYLPAIDQDD